MTPNQGPNVHAVNTTVAILEVIQTSGEVGVTELAETLDASKSNVHKHLSTLVHHGFVAKIGRRYRLGTRFIEFGSAVQRRSVLLNQAVAGLQRLADTTDAIALLTVPHRGMGTCLYAAVPGDESSRSEREGVRQPLHRTASGRAILSVEKQTNSIPAVDSLDDDALEDLRRELRTAANAGVAVVDDEGRPRREIAAPVIVSGRPIAAIGLAVDAATGGGDGLESNYISLVKQTAETVSKRMRFHDDDDLVETD